MNTWADGVELAFNLAQYNPDIFPSFLSDPWIVTTRCENYPWKQRRNLLVLVQCPVRYNILFSIIYEDGDLSMSLEMQGVWNVSPHFFGLFAIRFGGCEVHIESFPKSS